MPWSKLKYQKLPEGQAKKILKKFCVFFSDFLRLNWNVIVFWYNGGISNSILSLAWKISFFIVFKLYLVKACGIQGKKSPRNSMAAAAAKQMTTPPLSKNARKLKEILQATHCKPGTLELRSSPNRPILKIQKIKIWSFGELGPVLTGNYENFRVLIF